jgi:glycolate oxidase iron-sulfur subunit
MKTIISHKHLDTPTGQEANRILRSCVHCGFCNATCPTYLMLGDELDGPRGRIYLIKNMLESEKPTAKTQLHLDRCLTCRNCETTCPSGVEYGKLLDIGRELAADQVERSRGQQLFRFSLRKFLLSSHLFALALRFGQLIRPLLPEKLRQGIPTRIIKSLDWPTNSHARKILLVEGCVQTTLQPDTDVAAAIVLDRIGIQSLRIKAAGCCGAMSHHLDARQEAHTYIKRNIDAWWPLIEADTVEAICMTASGCGVILKDYGSFLAGDQDYADKARTVSSLYKDPSEIIRGADLKLKLARTRIAFHPPCTLQHGMKLSGVIEEILISAGFELVDFDNKHLCCGSAGTYSITQKKLSTELRNNKLATFEAKQPELIVTANIGCQTHMQSATDTPVRHWLELLVEQNVEVNRDEMARTAQ